MSLEDQQVPKAKVQELVKSLLTKEDLKESQFIFNQSQ